eukprot:CAMPEP_0118653204 /NCGR_PEP_ID=MMETSP0785-20121206/11712_1 /TAXON_ID=91992 /ORGANISM="Bolidomonas pacifica, Strain CCMP 1866" /LENGTH=494 /DNA_ID=CAMNT_0006545743 /DNA_START=155 /DNA_END=1636 /DNA_ORIENTATION=-
MKITEGSNASAPSLTPLEEATSLKQEALHLYKVQKYAEAAKMFTKAAEIVLLGNHPNTLPLPSRTLASACYSNASNAYLKASLPSDARTSATKCVEWSMDEQMEVKGRFRLAQALVSLASNSSASDGGNTSSYLSEAQSNLSKVLAFEPGNEQALELAREGLEISKKVIRGDKGNVHDEGIKEKARGEEEDEEKLLMDALNPQSNGNDCSTMGSNYMSNDWEAYQKVMKSKGQENPGKEEEKVPTPLPPSALASNIPSTTDLVNTLKASKKSNQPPRPDIHQTTTPIWDSMTESEAELKSSFNSIVSGNSYVVEASQVMETIKTTESNYSDGWRKDHLARRYKGKDKKFQTEAGKQAWEELEGMEEGAVKVVKQIGETKKKLSEKGGVSRTIKAGEDENGEGVKDWRKKLKQRRMGVEINTRKGAEKKKDKLKDEWEEMLGLESSEVMRANKLKEERRKAERLAEKKKKKDKLLMKKKKVKKVKEEDDAPLVSE